MNSLNKQTEKNNKGQLSVKRHCMDSFSVTKAPEIQRNQKTSTGRTGKNYILHKSKNINIIYCPLLSQTGSTPHLHVFELSIYLFW